MLLAIEASTREGHLGERGLLHRYVCHLTVRFDIAVMQVTSTAMILHEDSDQEQSQLQTWLCHQIGQVCVHINVNFASSYAIIACRHSMAEDTTMPERRGSKHRP